MNREEFGQKLSELQRKYNNTVAFTDAIRERITVELQCVLQDYLWEGQGFKTFNQRKYRQLALTWHPDKLKDLTESPQHSAETQFLLWYARQVQRNDNVPFQSVNTVERQYRPELRFRQRDMENTGAHFYFFGFFPRRFPNTYNIFWPLFYLLEALERNIDNYQNPTVREQAKRIYTILSLIPGCALSVLLVIMGANGGIDLLLLLSDSLGGAWLSSMIYSAVATGITIGGLYVICTLYLLITNNPEFDFKRTNLTDNILFGLPFEALRDAYNNKNFTQFGLLAGVLLVQVAVSAIGFWYAWPFLEMLCAFPLAGLTLVNAPLLMKQCYDNPRAAFECVKEYGFTVYNRYASLLTSLYTFATGFWHQPQQAAAQAQSSPPQAAGQPQSQPQQEATAPVPYWRRKLTKYLAKDADGLREKRRQLKQKRNEALQQHFRIGENHAFRERLDGHLAEKSVLTERGWPIDSAESRHENTVEALTVLNLKMQNLLLTQARQKGISSNQLQRCYPNQLDYHSLEEKDNVDSPFSPRP